MYDILTQCPLFKSVNPGEIEDLLEPIHHFTKTYEPGDMVALSGEECSHLMCVLEGSVKGEMVDYSGRVIKIEDIQAPRMLASAFIFGRGNRFPVNIISNESSRLLFIPKQEFIKLLQSNAFLLRNFLNTVSNRAQFLSDKIKFLSFKTIKGKFAQYILKVSEERDEFELPISQTALAELFGVTRPSLARVIHELVDQEIIRVDRRKIEILDRYRLKQQLKEH